MGDEANGKKKGGGIMAQVSGRPINTVKGSVDASSSRGGQVNYSRDPKAGGYVAGKPRDINPPKASSQEK